jgi:O-antigen/teichoic acid export membrane protein
MVQLWENLTQKFVRRGSWIYLFAFLSGPLWYAIKIMISHDISVTEVGILYSTLSLILLIGSLNDFWMVESLHYFWPKLLAEGNKKKVKAFFVYAFFAMILTSIITCTTLYFGSGYIATNYFNAEGSIKTTVITILQAFAFFLIINNLQHYFSTVAYVHQNTILAKGIDTLRLLLSALCGFFLFYGNGMGASDYAEIWNYGAIPATLLGGIFAWKYHLRELLEEEFIFSKTDFLELIKYSGWALLANNAIFLLSQIDIQLVMKLAWPEQAGLYSNYISLVSIPFLFVAPIIGFLFPVISAYNWAKQFETIKTIIQTFTRVFLLVWVATIGVLFALWTELWTFFFTSKFEASWHILYWSLGFLVFNFLLQINFNLLAAIGKVKKRLEIISYGIIINLILNYFLITEYQAAWSALAVGITWIVLWYLSYRATSEYHKKIDWKIQTINAISFILLWGLWFYLLIYFNIKGDDRMNFFGFTFVFLIISVGVFLLVHKKDLLGIKQTLKERKNQTNSMTQID